MPYTERATIGHDPETDVHVLVHGREKAGKSTVHDHGPCWVVYGNYRNPTRMRRWRRLDDKATPGHAELEMQKEFLNEPGHAAVFAVGDIHSIEYGDDTIFIRVTGGDVETKETLRFDVEKKAVTVAQPRQRRAVGGQDQRLAPLPEVCEFIGSRHRWRTQDRPFAARQIASTPFLSQTRRGEGLGFHQLVW